MIVVQSILGLELNFKGKNNLKNIVLSKYDVKNRCCHLKNTSCIAHATHRKSWNLHKKCILVVPSRPSEKLISLQSYPAEIFSVNYHKRWF